MLWQFIYKYFLVINDHLSQRIENGCTSKLILKYFTDRQTDLRERRKDALAVKCSKMHIASLSAVVVTMTAHLVRNKSYPDWSFIGN